MKKLLSILLAAVMLLSFAACTKNESSTDAQQITAGENADVTAVGEGQTVFDLTVMTADGSTTFYKVSTDKKTVGEALLDAELIAGENGAYGLYVKTVAGTTYDYDKDGKYWAFYVNGEYAPTGVDMTDITEGAAYMFKAE